VIGGLLAIAILGAFAVLGIAIWRHSGHSSAVNREPETAAVNPQPRSPQSPPGAPEIPVPSVSIPNVPGITGLPGVSGSKAGRELTYSFMVQQVRDGKPDGKPVPSSTLAPKSGSRFKLVVASPQPGSLYVIGIGKDGSPTVLFPKPEQKIASNLPAGKPVTLGWFEAPSDAVERGLCLVWSAYPIGELEAAASMLNNPAYTQYVGRRGPSAEIERFLQRHQAAAASVKAQRSGEKVVLHSAGDPLVYSIKLEER
jgi:hypothetical protein